MAVESKSSSLREAVAQKLKDSTTNVVVHEIVEAAFVKREIDRRSAAIIKGLDDLSSLDREIAKIDRPDVVTRNRDGSTASEAFSKDRLDALNKAEQKRDKLTKALDKALEGDVGDLLNLTGGKGGAPAAPAAEAE